MGRLSIYFGGGHELADGFLDSGSKKWGEIKDNAEIFVLIGSASS